jgi:hypothetical protein
MFMKRFAAVAIISAALSQTAMAESKIPSNLHHFPAKFCMVAGVMSAFIMERRNMGEPIEYLYEEVSQIEHKQLRDYMRETVSMTTWFDPMTPGKWFGQWNYNRCMEAMK